MNPNRIQNPIRGPEEVFPDDFNPEKLFKQTPSGTYKMSVEEIYEVAKSLIEKHKAYLDLTFFDYPKTIRSALHGTEIGLELILREVLNYDDKVVLMENFCYELYKTVIKQGIEYHKKICGKMTSDTHILNCGHGECIITRTEDSWAIVNQIGDREARILSLLLALNSKKLDEFGDEPYTASTIVKLLDYAPQTTLGGPKQEIDK
jgi:hypothetical protein